MEPLESKSAPLISTQLVDWQVLSGEQGEVLVMDSGNCKFWYLPRRGAWIMKLQDPQADEWMVLRVGEVLQAVPQELHEWVQSRTREHLRGLKARARHKLTDSAIALEEGRISEAERYAGHAHLLLRSLEELNDSYFEGFEEDAFS